jgi:hypothetical protein
MWPRCHPTVFGLREELRTDVTVRLPFGDHERDLAGGPPDVARITETAAKLDLRPPAGSPWLPLHTRRATTSKQQSRDTSQTRGAVGKGLVR